MKPVKPNICLEMNSTDFQPQQEQAWLNCLEENEVLQRENLLQLIAEKLIKIEGAVELNSQNLAAGMQQISKEFESKLKYDRHKELIIDKLHDELQLYKNDLYQMLMRPLIIGIITVIDDIEKVFQAYSLLEASEDNYNQVLSLLNGVSDDLEDILAGQGVEKFTCQDGYFDPAKQRVLQVVDAVCPTLDKKVFESVRRGYESSGKVIRPELVNVYRFKGKR